MFIHGARAAVLRVKREGYSLRKWMSGLETRAERNVVIVATANKLAGSVGLFGQRERLSPNPQNAYLFQLDESGFLRFASQKSSEEQETKTQSNGVPENLWRNEVFHDRGD